MWTSHTLKGDKSSLVFIIEVEHGLQLHIVQLAAAAAAFHGVLELGKSELSYSDTCSISIEKPLMGMLDVVFTFARFILDSLLVSNNPHDFKGTTYRLLEESLQLIVKALCSLGFLHNQDESMTRSNTPKNSRY